MYRNRKKRNIVIFSLVGVLFLMVAGYAAFSTNLEIKGTSKVTSNWDIEITNVTEGIASGSAENTVKPSWDKLWASMEADLYDKGDSMEYDVTIENKGNIDAKLNDILTNVEKENNEAVIITFSGYTKGEILKAGASKQVHVKIEYNPEYEGGETSSEVEINFDYVQNNNETNNPDTQYLVTYDYQTNGGTNADIKEEYYASGSNINLENTAYKEGWTFVGWNTDKDAEVGLESLQVKENTTLYAIYSKTLKVTYEKGENVESIGKVEDSCNIYNNQTSCEITLPEIKVSDEEATVGWYKDNENIGKPNDKYTINNDITLIAKAEFKPVIQSWNANASTDFHAEEYRTNIITATFVDNKDVPDNAVASWDVSAYKNGSVMAWVIADEQDSTKYHLYIGGKGGVIANTSSSYLFSNFTALTEINFGDNFDTSNVTGMGYMFNGCSNLTTIDVSNFDTSNVTYMKAMFRSCKSLTSLNVSNWDTNKVTEMSYMFQSCNSLITLDVGNFDTNKVRTMEYMFYSCNSLTILDVSNFDTSSVTNMSHMFNACSSLTILDVSNFDTSSVTNMGHMFYSCSSLTILDVSNFDTNNATNMEYMFGGCSSLITIDVSNFDTSNVTNMKAMFIYCKGLTSLNVSNWDTNKVTNMSHMFNVCSSLTILDVSNFDTNNATNMEYMFGGCSSLIKLVLCNWNTSKVTDMSAMFYMTYNLKSIYVGPNWTTDNATTVNMFGGSGVSSVIKSDNCEVDAEDITLNISTTSTTNSITVVANAHADSEIAKYEYSKDNGKTWIESTNNTYTFTRLTANTNYNIKVKVTSNIGKTLEKGTSIDITNNVVTQGDGLYADEYEEGKYTYKGADPNNYIWFNNEMWRILSIDGDGRIKIVRDELLPNRAFDTTGGTYGSNQWDRPSDIKTYLNGEYLESITVNKDKIESSTWSIGKVTSGINDLAVQIAAENGTQSQEANVGLITVSEYLRANTNKEQCENMSINNTNNATCKTTNWLVKGTAYWTISPFSGHSYSVFRVSASGNLTNINANNTITVLPALYLSSDISLSGTGTYENPYKITEGITTSTLEKPSFKETETNNGKTVTINYPEGCGNNLTCTYQKDNGEVVNVTSKTVDVEFTESGSLVANVSDGTNIVSTTYTVNVGPTIGGVPVEVVTQGDGLYADEYEEGKYTYKGANPNNYITFNNETWRILSIDKNNSLKIIRNDKIHNMYWDNSTHPVTNWDRPADIKTYLNEEYLESITVNKDKIKPSTWSIGEVTSNNNDLAGQVALENGTQSQEASIGLITVSEYLRANTNKEKCGSFSLNNSNYSICKTTNWISNTYNKYLYWTISSTYIDNISYAFTIDSSNGEIISKITSSTVDGSVGAGFKLTLVIPVINLTPSIKLEGTGSESDPYRIVN